MKLSTQNTTVESETQSAKTAQPTWRALFAALTAVFLISATGCAEQSQFDEAVEEVQDEAGDLKDKVKDEIDDHS